MSDDSPKGLIHVASTEADDVGAAVSLPNGLQHWHVSSVVVRWIFIPCLYFPPWVKFVYKTFVTQEQQCSRVPGTILSIIPRGPWDSYYPSVTDGKTGSRWATVLSHTAIQWSGFESRSDFKAWLLPCRIWKQMSFICSLKCIKCCMWGLCRLRQRKELIEGSESRLPGLGLGPEDSWISPRRLLSPGELSMSFRKCEGFFLLST